MSITRKEGRKEFQLQAGLDGRKTSSTLQTHSRQNLPGNFAHEVKEVFVVVVRRQAVVHHFAVHAHLSMGVRERLWVCAESTRGGKMRGKGEEKRATVVEKGGILV